MKDPKIPIIVAQMGKVGSTSISRALEGLGASVYHVHHLDRGRLDAIAGKQRQHGKYKTHIGQSYEVLSEIVARGRAARVVSMVRDPIARNISAFFQNKRLFAGQHHSIDALITTFLDTYPHDVPLHWFDVHIRPIFGIDVFSNPFDHQVRCAVAAHDKNSLIVLRTEDNDAQKAAALQAFFGHSAIVVGRANVGAEKQYASEYRKFIDRIRLPGDYIDRMLDSKMARHFYTEAELDSFDKRWRKPRLDKGN